MGKTFADFISEFRAALKRGDRGFVKTVYQDWVDSSGMLPPQYRETFADLVLEDVGPLAEATIVNLETFDDFGVVNFADPSDPDTETSIMFREKDGKWVMFNGRSNFVNFRKAYTLSYRVEGGRVAVQFNGKRHPLISEQVEDPVSGMVSPLNCTLKVGENTLDVVPLAGEPKVELRLSSAEEGEIADSSESDVLLWEGAVAEPLSLPFTAE